MEHELKIYPAYFSQVADGDKTFEIRKNDRGFQKGDTVVLKEYVSQLFPKFTGRKLKARIGYVTQFEQKEGYVVFSLKEVMNED